MAERPIWRRFVAERRRLKRAKQGRRGPRFRFPLNLSSGTTRIFLLLLVLLVALVGALSWALGRLEPVASGREIPYSKLEQWADFRWVRQVTLHDFDKRVTGHMTVADDRVDFWTTYPESDAQTPLLMDRLVDSGAIVSVDRQTEKSDIQFVSTFVLPLVILANLFGIVILLTRGGGDGFGSLLGFSSIGKGRGKAGDQGVTFADVAGADDAIVEVKEVVDYLREPERFAALGARPPKGILMMGPPGTGKTLISRALAGEAQVPFFSVSGAEFVESLVGVGAARVRDLFRQVREAAPAIVFIDEIDAAGRKRGGASGGQEEREQTLNQLLIEMDGFDPASGVVVIGATNRPDILDPALLRPGRFDRQVTIEPPDLEGRDAIFRLYLDKRPLEEGIDPTFVARRTPGFTGADIANTVNEAALLAIREERTRVSSADLEEAVQRVMHGPKRRGHLMSERERERAAHHEAAHLVVAAAAGLLGEAPRVSIVSHSSHQAVRRRFAERTLITRAELFTELASLLSGVAAEETAFGEASTGGEADLDAATALAQVMVGRYGMSERLGKVRLLRTEGSEFLNASMVPVETAGEDLLGALHAEVRILIDDADAAARALLRRHSRVHRDLVERLLDHESLDGPALEPLIAPIRAGDDGPALLLDALESARTNGTRRRSAPKKPVSSPTTAKR